jgi:glycosyltransferase involved in cell wall biosynthesis
LNLSEKNDSPCYIIVSPVRDEERYIEYTLKAVINQTVKPSLWIIVDDGSTDATGEISDKYAAQYDWIKVLHRKNRGYRAAGSGVIAAFNEGYAGIDIKNWDFIVKLDGDLSFDPDYFERCFSLFAADDTLGIAGGTVFNHRNGELVVDSAGDPPFHVRGATKIYRHACWEKISPLVQAPGWDTIDEVKANYYGWTTRTFADIKLIQNKPTGGADGNWRNWYKNGLANYITGYHPIFMLAKCVKRLFQKPFFIASAALFIGFCSGYWKRTSQVQDIKVIRYLRKQQLRYLFRLPSIYG